MFYILTTYCDTVSSFVGYGKKTAWSIWNTLPQLTDALLKLSCAPREIPNDVMLIIEIYCLVIWQDQYIHIDIDKVWERLFTKRTNVKAIHQTGTALEQHEKKVVYQGGCVWGMSLIANAVSPSSTSWG